MFQSEKLEEAFHQVATEAMRKQIHEWIIYTAPPDILKIYHTYLELCEKELEDEIKVDM